MGLGAIVDVTPKAGGVDIADAVNCVGASSFPVRDSEHEEASARVGESDDGLSNVPYLVFHRSPERNPRLELERFGLESVGGLPVETTQ